jgi:hypothetical protein
LFSSKDALAKFEYKEIYEIEKKIKHPFILTNSYNLAFITREIFKKISLKSWDLKNPLFLNPSSR